MIEQGDCTATSDPVHSRTGDQPRIDGHIMVHMRQARKYLSVPDGVRAKEECDHSQSNERVDASQNAKLPVTQFTPCSLSLFTERVNRANATYENLAYLGSASFAIST